MQIRHFTFLVFILLVLNACAPTSYVYLKPNMPVVDIEQVTVMVEYLNIKEGFDTHWNFDENVNLNQQDALYDMAVGMLQKKGYRVSDKSLKTSGFIMDRSFLVDHFLNKKKQSQLLSAPYIVRSVNLDDATIQGFEMLLAELNSPMSAVMSDLRSYVKNNYAQQLNAINIEPNSAVLIIKVYKPRQVMLPNIGFGVSTSMWDSSVNFNSETPRPESEAYLIHKDSGEVLWSNKTSLLTVKNQAKFFADLPKNMSGTLK